MKKVIICAALLALASGHVMADLAAATKAGQFGKWTVLREKDKMTDKTICTGVQGRKHEIQLSDNALYLTVSGGPSSVALRFDDKPARALRLATDMEKKIDVVILEGGEFEEAKQSSKVLAQVNTLVSGVKTLEIDTRGIDQAVKFIVGACVGGEAQATDSGAASTAPIDGGICTPELQDRMRKAGVKQAQITKICSN